MSAVYLERGQSAKTANRKQLLAALDFVSKNKGEIAYFIVHKIDRLARQSQDFFNLKAQLAAHKCRIISVTEPLEDTPAGRFMESVLVAQAQFDNEVRAERCRTGMAASVQRGAWVWMPPLGFKTARLTDNTATLIHDPVTAPMVRKMFEAFANGATQSELVRMAAQNGLLGRTGNPLSKQTIGMMLRNCVYAARLRTKLAKGDLPGNWKPIVSAELFDRVQMILRGSAQTRVPHKSNRPEFILKGFLRCAECGRKLTASWSKGRKGTMYPYYHCTHCKKQRLRLEEMHAEFGHLLDRTVPAQEYIDRMESVARDYVGGAAKAAQEEREAKLEAQSKFNKEECRLLDLLVRGTINDAIYTKRMDDLRAQRAQICSEVTHTNAEFQDLGATLIYARQVLLEPRYFWCNASDDGRLAFQRFWFEYGISFDRNAGVGTTLKPTTAKGFPFTVVGCNTVVGGTGLEPV